MALPPNEDPMAVVARALTQLAQLQDRSANALAAPRVRAINCRSFKIPEDWNNYSIYFRENIRATYGYAHGDPALNTACCSWIGSKLEAGPTLTAYESLSQAIKNDWVRLNNELAILYVNEEEKQSFLANVGGFKKGSQSLLAYKNELTRLVNLYQPELHTVATEYQRQLVDRFIGGLDDPELQKKLRFHCRRDKMTIDVAFEFAVDYEATEVEEKAKELASSARAHVTAAVAKAPNFSANSVGSLASSSLSSSAPMKILERSVDPKIKANEIAIEQIKAAQAKTDDSIDIMRKEINEKMSDVGKKMDQLEFLITANGSIQQGTATPQFAQPLPMPQPMPAPAPRPYQPRMNSRPYRQQSYQHVPSLTGGPGYRVDPRMRPNWHERPVGTEITPSAANASPLVNDAMPAQSQMATLGACASMPQPIPQSMPQPVAQPVAQPQPMSVAPQPTPQLMPQPMPATQFAPPSMPHPMRDLQQQAYPYQEEFWAEHLDYEPTPMGYQPEPTGTHFYYPQYFQ